MEWSHASLALGAALLVCLFLIGRLCRRLRRKRDQLLAFEREEARMFHFLHDLGESIGRDFAGSGLYRVIVEGVLDVVGGRGGAIYLLDESGDNLLPKYLSEACPALARVPDEVLGKSIKDPRALESYLRLTTLASGEGVIGEVTQTGMAVHEPDFRAVTASGESESLALLVSPLRHGERILGALIMAREAADEFTPNDISVFRSAADQSGFALGNALLHREAAEKRQIESDLRSASEVQRVLLPQGEPLIPGYRVAGDNLPARIISGDYYDHLELANGSHGLVIADVSGKGVAAGLMMAMCRSVLRAEADGSDDPAAVLATVNRQLFPDMREDMFISLFYGVIAGDGSEIQLVRAGHDAALCYRAGSREVVTVKPPGLAIGIDDGSAFERVTRTKSWPMGSGDCLLFFTDGVKEAEDPAGEQFGEKRLEAAFLRAAPMGAEAVVRAIKSELADFTGEAPQMDDVTLLVMERR